MQNLSQESNENKTIYHMRCCKNLHRNHNFSSAPTYKHHRPTTSHGPAGINSTAHQYFDTALPISECLSI